METVSFLDEHLRCELLGLLVIKTASVVLFEWVLSGHELHAQLSVLERFFFVLLIAKRSSVNESCETPWATSSNKGKLRVGDVWAGVSSPGASLFPFPPFGPDTVQLDCVLPTP